MQKGENIVSIALAAVVLLVVIAMQRRWDPADLKDVASSAEDYLLTAAMGGEAPDIAGYERLKTIRLGDYRAGLYRATPAPLTFAQGRVVVYDSSDKPVFRIETLEGSVNAWSAIYDFNSKSGQTQQGKRAPRAAYTRDLNGDGVQDAIVGQYSGGDHCCTKLTVLELGKDGVKAIGSIDGIDGLPFDGVEVRKLTKGVDSQVIVHRPYQTACGSHYDAADVLGVYTSTANGFQDQTLKFGDFLQEVLRQNLARWKQEKNHNMELLQTIAVDFAVVGQKDAGNRFFADNLPALVPTLQAHNIDPNACLDSLGAVIDHMPVVDQ